VNLPDDYLSIDTPENVAFGYDIAGIGSRFLAAAVDTILIIVLQLIVNLTLLFLARSLFETRLDDSNSLIWLSAVFGLIAFGFLWGYYIIFEMLWNGQSPGKRWVGLRVIRTDGTPITLTESIIRNLVRLIDFLPVYYGVGVVTMFVNEQARRLGDLAAGTLVVHDRDTITLESLAQAKPLRPLTLSTNNITSTLPTERLTPHDLQIVEDFLRRRSELANRQVLARRLVQVLYDRMGLPVPEFQGREAEERLSEIIEASQHRSRS
jgi:uncharacterized RDD family membrane protein YckC